MSEAAANEAANSCARDWLTHPAVRHYSKNPMAAKPSDDHSNLLQWLYERGEETVEHAVRDLIGRRGLTDGLSKVIDGAAKTRGRLNKNVEIMLHLLNLPSRTDYHRLLLKVEHLQGSLINLSMKLDRLLAAQQQPPTKPNRKAKPQH